MQAGEFVTGVAGVTRFRALRRSGDGRPPNGPPADHFAIDLEADTVNLLAEARTRQQDPAWRDDYRATRPKVERKLAHLLRSGRHARRRGLPKVDADWNYIGAAVNYARMARLGLRNIGGS